MCHFCLHRVSREEKGPPYTTVGFHSCFPDSILNASYAFKALEPDPHPLVHSECVHFAHDSKNTIYTTCHLKVNLTGEASDQLNTVCSFSKASDSWSPVESISTPMNAVMKRPVVFRLFQEAARPWHKSAAGQPRP
ncbi:Zona pellucida sperm-binding protein 3 [Tupaia chinensis]|uniref:Zona pellucida sperm-binding protein 3 n=1 Tax=Tupaia chinensis TaxID=246437 RepID=L9L4X5_TUPCH|nr:Zona pellucida sperm-binding protein 3 [Tupaia chinensis]